MTAAPGLRLRSPRGRWALGTIVLGSAVAFLEGSIVTVALPDIAADLELDVAGVQWVYNAYLVSLSALILLGGGLGDRHGRRRVYALGLVLFAATSLACAVAPSLPLLVAVRMLQGAAGALVVPLSLAIVDTVFAEEDRGAAIGAWAGWSGVATAFGPFIGGWLVDVGSWRWVFVVPVPLALLAAGLAAARLPETRAGVRAGRLDSAGAALVVVAMAAGTYALVEGPRLGLTAPLVAAAGTAALAATGFVVVERRVRHPLLPLRLFGSTQFTGTNAVTLVVYFALGGVFLLLVVHLQTVLGYSALAAGASLAPVNVVLLLASPRTGALAQRVGAGPVMAAGGLTAAMGCALLARLDPGSGYLGDVLPGVAVFGAGLALIVAPLTAAVLAAVPTEQAGVGSAVNNAVARFAGLLAGALLPLAAGLAGLEALDGSAFAAGFERAMWIAAGCCVVGALLSLATVRRTRAVRVTAHPSPQQGCVQRRPCDPPAPHATGAAQASG